MPEATTETKTSTVVQAAPRRSRALRLGLAALGLAALLLATGEVAARYLYETPPPRPIVGHPFFGFVRSPHYKQTRWSSEDPPYEFEFETNALGFRGKSMTGEKKPPGTYRIFFVGGSTTENQHLPEEKTFAGLVEAGLAARASGQPRIEVANCGIYGSATVRSLSLIAHRILQLEPDLIVLLDGENDLTLALDPAWDPSLREVDTYSFTFKDWLIEESRLVAVLDAKLSRKDVDTRRRGFERRRQQARAKPYSSPDDVYLLRGLPYFKSYLRRIALLCEDARVPLVLMTQPTIWREDQTKEEEETLWMSSIPGSEIHLDPKTCTRLMAAYNEAIRDVASSRRLGLVDLDRTVPKNLACFYDDAHLTAEGNRKIAEAVLARIWPLPRPAREGETATSH